MFAACMQAVSEPTSRLPALILPHIPFALMASQSVLLCGPIVLSCRPVPAGRGLRMRDGHGMPCFMPPSIFLLRSVISARSCARGRSEWRRVDHSQDPFAAVTLEHRGLHTGAPVPRPTQIHCCLCLCPFASAHSLPNS